MGNGDLSEGLSQVTLQEPTLVSPDRAFLTRNWGKKTTSPCLSLRIVVPINEDTHTYAPLLNLVGLLSLRGAGKKGT